MSDAKIRVLATVDDHGEHHGRTDFLPIQADHRGRQLAIQRREGIFYLAHRARGQREFTVLMEGPFETFLVIRRLLQEGGGTAWVSDSDSEFGLEVAIDREATAEMARGDERTPIRFEAPEVQGLIALVDWVESTFSSPA